MTQADANDIRSGWGRNIAAARAALGISQAELARRLGLTVVTVGRWEAGMRRPADDHQPMLALELGVSVTELLPRTQDEAEIPVLLARLGNGCS